MKTSTELILLLVAMLGLSACLDQASRTVPPPANGSYWIRKDGTLLPLHLASRPKYVSVFSVANDNSLYTVYITFETVASPGELLYDGLLIGGKHIFKSPNSTVITGRSVSLTKSVVDNEAKLISEAFGVSCRKRHDPGFKMRFTLEPVKKSLYLGEEVLLQLEVSNRGAEAFAFKKLVVPRNNDCGPWFRHIVTLGAKLRNARPPAVPVAGGGIMDTIILPPGGADTNCLNVTDIGDFDSPGNYSILTVANIPVYAVSEGQISPYVCWNIPFVVTNTVHILIPQQKHDADQ